MENYKYILKYTNGDKSLTYEIPAEITMTDLKDELMYFLRGCSWTEAQTAFLEEDPEAKILQNITDIIKRAKKEGWTAEEILENLDKEFIS